MTDIQAKLRPAAQREQPHRRVEEQIVHFFPTDLGKRDVHYSERERMSNNYFDYIQIQQST